MAGHKVRCQCGFVFRLGPKTEKQPGFAEDLKRRRAVKERRIATYENAFQLKKPRVAEELLAPVEIEQPGPSVAEEELLKPVEIDQPQELLKPIELDELDELLQPIKMEQERQPKPSTAKKTSSNNHQPAPVVENKTEPAEEAIEAKPMVDDLDGDDLLADNEPLLADPVVPDPPTPADESDEHIHTAELEPDESILDAIPISSYQQPDSKPPRFKQADSVSALDTQQIIAEVVTSDDPMANVAPNPGQAYNDLLDDQIPAMPVAAPMPIASPMPLAVSAPTRKLAHQSKRKRKRGEVALASPAGPIASLVVAILGVPIMMFITFFAIRGCWGMISLYNQLAELDALSGGSNVNGNVILAILSTGLLSTIYAGLTICIIVSAVTAVMELTSSTYIGWAHKLAAIVATAVLVLLFFGYVYRVGNYIYAMESLKQARQSMGVMGVTSNVSMGPFILKTTLISMGYAVVPLAVAICGFLRGRK